MRQTLIALALILPGAAIAQDCANAVTQLDLNACAAAEWQAADAELNDAYQAAMAAMRQIDANLTPDLSGAADALRQAQRSWITFRDAACIAEGFQVRGGSAEPMLVAGCKTRLTRTRSEDLWTLTEQN